jgi:DNA-binding CsgD family transcriptional regulator/PAS domain-containing protein
MGVTRPSSEPNRLSDVIEAIYDGVLDSSLWPKAIEPVRAYVHADSALLRVYGRHWGSVLQSMSTGFDPAFQEAYRQDFIHEDPIVPVLEALPPGTMVILDQELPFSQLQRTRFYQEYMKSQDKRHVLGGPLLRVGDSSVMIGFQRAHGAPAFTLREQQRAQALVPHWVRALKLADRLRREQLHATMSETLLGEAAPGLLLFDADGRVVFQNPAAQGLLSRQEQLVMRNQRLSTRNRRLQSWLDTALVVRNRKDWPHAWEGSSARFTSPDQREDLALALLPWRGDVALTHGFMEAVTAGILTPLRPPGSFSVSMIQSLFSLSLGEARLAEALTRTGSLAQAAAELGIQISTARDRLKSVFRKTGFDSQVALVTAVLGSPTRLNTAM